MPPRTSIRAFPWWLYAERVSARGDQVGNLRRLAHLVLISTAINLDRTVNRGIGSLSRLRSSYRRSCADERACQGWRSHHVSDAEGALYSSDREVR